MDTFYNYWREWFAQPEAEKLKHLRQPGRGGYYPLGSEAPGYTGKPDPKEYFHWRLSHGTLGKASTRSLFWDCYDRAWDWCDERGLHAVNSAVCPTDCVLRILHYLPTPDGLVGQAHRDYDLLTVSVPGTCPGLEVCVGNRCADCRAKGLHCSEGRDHWIPQEEGIQVGEMLEIYSSAWATVTDAVGGSQVRAIGKPEHPATLHRVRTPPNTERFKAVFFYLPPKGFELRPGYTADDYLKDALTHAGTIDVGVKA